MRALFVVLGVALVVVGGALVISPVHEAQGFYLSGPTPTSAIGLDLPYAIGDTVQYNVSWTGGGNSTYVLAYECGSGKSHCPGTDLVASEGGPAGAFTLALPPGDYFTLNSTAPINVTVAASISGAYGLVGLPPLVLGLALMSYGWMGYASGVTVPTGASRRLDYYLAAMCILLVAAGLLLGYILTLGTLTGAGIESSFALAVGLALLDVGLMFHIFDIVYRDRALAAWREQRD